MSEPEQIAAGANYRIVPVDWEIQDIEVAITDIKRFLESRGGKVFLRGRQSRMSQILTHMPTLKVVTSEKDRETMAEYQGELRAITPLFAHESLGMNPLLRERIEKLIEKEKEM